MNEHQAAVRANKALPLSRGLISSVKGVELQPSAQPTLLYDDAPVRAGASSFPPLEFRLTHGGALPTIVLRKGVEPACDFSCSREPSAAARDTECLDWKLPSRSCFRQRIRCAVPEKMRDGTGAYDDAVLPD